MRARDNQARSGPCTPCDGRPRAKALPWRPSADASTTLVGHFLDPCPAPGDLC